MKINSCRISNSSNLIPILDLGKQPLANSLKETKNEKEELFPLQISFCEESSLLQLDHTIDKKKLFKNYIWVSGTSLATLEYATIFCENILRNNNIKKDDLIIEIASNDGTFLKPFKEKNYFNLLGIDPARNIAKIANSSGIKTIPTFWSHSISKKILNEYGHAKIVFARNVIPHVSELHDVIKGISNIINKHGIGIIEFHYAGKILSELHYDSIYHEHLCYFSIKSITYLLNKYKLYPYDIFESPISGGSLVISFSKQTKNKTGRLINFENLENKNKINSLKSWGLFAKKTLEHKLATLKLLDEIKTYKIIGFGSSARSQTYINYCGITNNQIPLIIDNNVFKQNKFAPGSSIPIVSLKKGLQINPDYIFIFAWNFKNEIISECRNNGFKGKFILPFPNLPRILG